MTPALVLWLAAAGVAADAVKLEPNATLRLEFPDLPETLADMSSGKRQVPLLTATLPANYARGGKFPLFIWQHGTEGGRGDRSEFGRKAVGPDDFITVNMPLFKRVWDKSKPAAGLAVLPEDYEALSKAYRVMLQKLLGTVPNVDAARSAMGGFSNGAHATGVLLARHDPFLLEHVRNFFLLEGGFHMLTAEALDSPALKGCRVITLRGDRGRPAGGKSRFSEVLAAQEEAARRAKLDFTPVVMRGYGHEQPGPYLKMIGQWARGEKLTEVPPKPPAPAKAP